MVVSNRLVGSAFYGLRWYSHHFITRLIILLQQFIFKLWLNLLGSAFFVVPVCKIKLEI